MSNTSKQYILSKYLPFNNGRLEINVTASALDDYEITGVYFFVQHGNVVAREDITFYMLASRLCGDESIDEWIAELLPGAMGADTFMDDADRAYEEAYK